MFSSSCVLARSYHIHRALVLEEVRQGVIWCFCTSGLGVRWFLVQVNPHPKERKSLVQC